MRTKATSVGKVLIRAPNWIGDAVMAEPALRRLRGLFRDAHVAIIAPRPVADLYDGEGLADEIIVTNVRGVKSFIRECRRLGRLQFDLAVLLQNAFSAALFAKASGIRRVAGYPTDGRRLLLNPVIALDRNHKAGHQVFYYMRIASGLESALTGAGEGGNPAGGYPIAGEEVTPRLRATGESRDRAARLLAEQGIESGAQSGRGPLLLLNPGATNSRAKRWLPERFAEIADLLAAEMGFRTAIIGAAGDLEVAQRVAGRMRTGAAVLAGKTEIPEVKGLLAHASLLVSNDTVAAHIVAALHLPTVVIFGPTEHFATHPFSDHSTIVRHPVECSPCMLRDCPIDHRCMTGVQVGDVIQAVERLLGLRILPAGISSAVRG